MTDEHAAWPGGIKAITLFFDDLPAARAFYQEVFGLPIVFEDANSVVFEFGGTLANLLKREAAVQLVAPAIVADREAGARFQLTIEVEDADATCTRLTARGAQLVNGPMDRPWGVRTAAFMDPGGHIWEIAQPLS
jgi:catechol 2,3-dioxygenase-like lactoylglutathione lyase family enzyme